MKTTSYPLKTAVIDKMTIPFTVRLALNDEAPELSQLFKELISEITADLTDVDETFSPFKSTSLVTQFRAGDGSPLLTSTAFAEVFSLAQIARQETDGYFDPFFDGNYNPTGLVKGWAINQIFDQRLRPLLADPAIVGVSLNGGGDIVVAIDEQTNFRWQVGIEDPFDDTMILGQYELRNQAIATSGISRRGEHIKRMRSSLQQVTIVSDTLVFADTWATAGMAAGTEMLLKLIAKYQLTGVLVDARRGQLHFSEGSVQSW